MTRPASPAAGLVCANMRHDGDKRARCADPVTHLDEKGYVYCFLCAQVRRCSHRVRRLAVRERKHLESGQPLASYNRGASLAALAQSRAGVTT